MYDFDDSKAPNAGNVVRTTPTLMSPFVRVEDKPWQGMSPTIRIKYNNN